jgi:adenylate kinase
MPVNVDLPKGARSPKRLILIGPPGVGKGTISALLTKRLGLETLSSGVIFRREIEMKTDLGRLANRYIRHGELVPNGVTISMMEKQLQRPEIRESGFVLDGFPRTVKQAEALDEILFELEIGLDKVISLEVPEEVIVSRLSGRLGCTRCGEIYHSVNKPPMRPDRCDKCDSPLFVREDDKPETIRERIATFWESTAPVIDYYATTASFQRIDASKGPEETFAKVIQPIHPT